MMVSIAINRVRIDVLSVIEPGFRAVTDFTRAAISWRGQNESNERRISRLHAAEVTAFLIIPVGLVGGSAMRRLPAAIAGLAATTLCVAPALAHHSRAMFDTSKEH
jgi:hypothetical protein